MNLTCQVFKYLTIWSTCIFCTFTTKLRFKYLSIWSCTKFINGRITIIFCNKLSKQWIFMKIDKTIPCSIRYFHDKVHPFACHSPTFAPWLVISHSNAPSSHGIVPDEFSAKIIWFVWSHWKPTKTKKRKG